MDEWVDGWVDERIERGYGWTDTDRPYRHIYL
jgi:hypothetical protein